MAHLMLLYDGVTTAAKLTHVPAAVERAGALARQQISLSVQASPSG